MSKGKNKYELMLLIDPEVDHEEVLPDVKELFVEYNFDVLDEEEMGLRTLAYPIKHKVQGRYYIYYLDTDDVANVDELNKELVIKDEVLRFVILARGGE